MQPLPSSRHNLALSTATAFVRVVEITFTRGTESVVVEPDGGRWTQDARRSLRWDGSCIVTTEDLIPSGPSDLLTPFGTKAAVDLGVQLADGSTSTVPFGRFILNAAEARITPNSRSVDIKLVDLAEEIAGYRFEEPFTIPAGSDLAEAVNLVVADRIGVSPNLADTGHTLALQRVFGLETQLDPWRELIDLAAGFGFILYFDRAGTLQLTTEPFPDISTAVPLVGQLALSGAWESRPANVAVVRGESSGDTPPVQGVALDDDPSSPTYAGTAPGTSPYGRITKFLASPILTTQSAVDIAAQSLLRSSAGGGAAWSVAKPFDPTFDPNDIVIAPGPLNLLIDAVTVSSASGTTMECRAPAELVGETSPSSP